jgi:hypothetical protein
MSAQTVRYINLTKYLCTKLSLILIAGKELGLTVIEVKSCTIDQIEVVEASRWVMVPSFYSRELLPFKQAQKQLDALLGRIDRIHKLIALLDQLRYRLKAERVIHQKLWCTSRKWEPL